MCDKFDKFDNIYGIGPVSAKKIMEILMLKLKKREKIKHYKEMLENKNIVYCLRLKTRIFSRVMQGRTSLVQKKYINIKKFK
jgi:hypothetical protein